MKGLKTYPRGGVHPPDRKTYSEDKAIEDAPVPEILTVPLSQHLGKPAECVVEKGDEIEEGALIGKASGFISAAIHSPVKGTVKEITEVYLHNGLKSKALVIEKSEDADGFRQWEKLRDWQELPIQEIIDLVAESGIVGLGGATFPTQVKLMVPKGKKAEFFIVNGVECEPYLTLDYRLMREKTKELLEGTRIVEKVLAPKKVMIGIEENKPQAIARMEQVLAEMGLPYELVPLKMKYPQGDEKLLIKAATGREVPSGGLPIDIGTVVSNAGTVFAIYEAVVCGKPLIERFLTVTGGAVERPANLRVRIGTKIGDIIDACGGFKGVPEKIVIGGPMTGFAVHDLDIPVIKGSGGILALTAEEVRGAKRTSCISCGRCVSICPMGLNPTTLFKLIDHLEYEAAAEMGMNDCRECGSCGFVCPAHIPLVQGIKLGKKMARKKG
jgi:Na+-translocating ferredoxin:NAD+ oxidoreductase subunit C